MDETLPQGNEDAAEKEIYKHILAVNLFSVAMAGRCTG